VSNSYFIGNVQVSLKNYTGNDQYSDGDIEAEMLELVKKESLDEINLVNSDHRWPILYHFSPIRKNLLEWFQFDSTGSALEIGGGCGALTSLLCDRLSEVTVVELSRRRAEINAYRNKSRRNLKIRVGDFDDMEFEGQYDYATLIGVLEYAGKFSQDINPHERFLKQIRKCLKPNGLLILAIENKFGLKYWAGTPEDHVSRHYEGLENYPSKTGVLTFSKKELIALLELSGFTDNEFYYPVPDYKLPTQVFSDNYLPSIGQIDPLLQQYDQVRHLVFDERKVLDNLILNDQFGFFSNSFLVVSKRSEEFV